MKQFLTIVFLYIVCSNVLFATASNFSNSASNFSCKNSNLGFGSQLWDMTGRLSMCAEHEKRTCCTRQHTDVMVRTWFSIVSSLDSDISESCATATKKLMCSVCDGDVGLGVSVSQKGKTSRVQLCSDFCNYWYSACENDYFSLTTTKRPPVPPLPSPVSMESPGTVACIGEGGGLNCWMCETAGRTTELRQNRL
eukprot:Platyproteum_vivax@DN1596_c0_g1_i1.p1